MKSRRIVRIFLGCFIAIIFLWLMFRHIKLSEFVNAFTGTRFSWIIAALGSFCIGYFIRIERWWLMFQKDNPKLSRFACVGPFFASFAVNNVLPFRAGDLLRSFAFNRQLGVTSGVVLASLFVERLLDMLMVLIFLGLALGFFGLKIHRFAGIGSNVLLTISLIIVCVLFFPKLLKPVAFVLHRLFSAISPKWGEVFFNEVTKSLSTLDHLSRGNSMFKLILLSLMAWTAEGCVFWFSGLALPRIITPLAGWLALPVGTLSTLIPSTPGYVGTFDFFTGRAMTELGNSVADATAYSFLVHALLWLPPTVIGMIYLIQHPVSYQKK